MIELTLRYAIIRVHGPARLVTTALPSGHTVAGFRADTDAAREEARDAGYPATAAGVWRSLVEHELTHSIIAQHVLNAPSLAMRHESGAERVPVGLRLWEEAAVIGFQTARNRGTPVMASSPALWGFSAAMLRQWERTLRTCLDGLGPELDVDAMPPEAPEVMPPEAAA